MSLRMSLFAAMLFAPSAAFCASASEPEPSLFGTTFVKHTPTFVDGKLTSCSLEYAAMEKDYAYKNGGIVTYQGSVSFTVNANKRLLMYYLKLLVSDVEIDNTTPVTITSANFVFGNETSQGAILADVPTERAGGRIVMIDAMKTVEQLSKAIGENNLIISYARNKGGIDAQFRVDLTVVDTSNDGKRTFSDKNTRDYITCSQKLLDNTIKGAK